jgi:hypothetical protein
MVEGEIIKDDCLIEDCIIKGLFIELVGIVEEIK